MPQQKDHSKEKNTEFIITSIIVIIVIIGLWIVTYITLKDWTTEKRGTFGDMFGSVNALFSGLALAGIILTILLQRKELSLQRQELKETREELKRSATAQEKSEKALRKQAENLKISAKLSALNILVNYNSELIEKFDKVFGISDHKSIIMDKRDRYIRLIEEILEQKEDDI